MLQLVCDALSLTSAGKLRAIGDKYMLFLLSNAGIRAPSLIQGTGTLYWQATCKTHNKTQLWCVSHPVQMLPQSTKRSVCVHHNLCQHRSQSCSLTYTMCRSVPILKRKRPPFIHRADNKISLISKLTCACLF